MNHRTHVVTLSLLAVLALVGLAPRAAGTPRVFASRLAAMRGSATSGMVIVNRDDHEYLYLDTDFYRQGETTHQHIPISLPPIPPLSFATVYSFSAEVKTPGLYAAHVHGDRPLAALVRTDWPDGGASVLYNVPEAATDLLLPLVLKDSYGHTSFITIQNTDTLADHDIRVAFTRTGELGGPRLTLTLRLPRGQSRTLDLAADPQLADLPAGFAGTARVTSEVPVAVSSDLDIAGAGMAAYGFIGVPSSAAAETLFAPLVAAQGGRLTDNTLMAIANPGPAQVAATITLRGTGGSCAGQTHVVRTGGIQPGSNALIYRWPGTPAGPNADVVDLPAGCIGAATIQSSGGPLLATVAYVAADGSVAAGYNAFRAEDAGRRTLLPLYRNQHTASKRTTIYQIMNVGAETATFQIDIDEGNGMKLQSCGARPCSPIHLAPGTAFTFLPSDVSGLLPGRYGDARIESDQPLAVVALDESLNGRADRAIYRGIPADPQATPAPGAPTAQPDAAFAPLYFINAQLDGALRPTPDAVVVTPAAPPRPAVSMYLPLGYGGD